MSLQDVIKLGSIIVAGIFSVLILYTILNDGLVGSNLDTTITTPSGSFSPVTEFMAAFRLFDYVVVFVVFGLMVVSAISAYRIRTDPVYIIPAFIFFILTSIVATIFQDVLTTIVGQTAFSSIISNFPLIQLLASNLTSILLGFFILLTILMYGIHKKEEGYYG